MATNAPGNGRSRPLFHSDLSYSEEDLFLRPVTERQNSSSGNEPQDLGGNNSLSDTELFLHPLTDDMFYSGYSPPPVNLEYSPSFDYDFDHSPHQVVRRNSSLSDSERPDFGGYNCSFVSEPPDVYTCLICTFVAKDCQQIDCCGKIYCRQCLAENQKESMTCPHCRNFGYRFNDKKSDREIKALKVKCDNLDNGCQWVGELRSLEEHVHTCGYGLTPCTLHCQEDDGQIVKMLRKYLKKHLRNRCPQRPYRCPHCRKMGEYKERTTLHMDSCPRVKVHCPNAPCPDIIPRCDVSIHRSLCDYEKIRCEFSDIGCQETPFRKSLKDHVSHTHYIPYIIDVNQILKEDIKMLKARNNEQENHIQKLEKRSNKQDNEIQSLTKKSNEQDEQIQMLGKRLWLVSSNIPYTFKLENYQRLTEEQKHFTSPPFYRAGYKFSVRIFTGGNRKGGSYGGNGRGVYLGDWTTQLNLSAGVSLLKGEDDDSLTWPFTGSVTVELLNQLEDDYHALVTIQFKAEDAHSQRVIDNEFGKECRRIKFNLNGMMSGCTWQFLHEDSLVFRVSIENPWLHTSTSYIVGHGPWQQD